MEDTRQDGEWGHENQGIGNDESKDGTMDRETQKTPLTYKKHNLSFNSSNKPSHRLQCNNNKQTIGHLDFENFNLIQRIVQYRQVFFFCKNSLWCKLCFERLLWVTTISE